MSRTHCVWLLRVAVTTLAALGCGDAGNTTSAPGGTGADKGSGLRALLPPAPDGWTVDGDSKEETIAEGGSRAWATYRPVPESTDDKAVEKVEVTIARFPKDLSVERQKEVRRISMKGGQFMEAIKVAGFDASASAPIYEEQIVTVFVGPWHVDVVAHAPGKDHAGAARAAAVRLAEKIDLRKLKDRE
jgi:hypothetical protein